MARLTKRGLTLAIRLLVLAATLTAVIVMVTSHETVSSFGLSLEARYDQTPAFKYFVIANSIVSVYGFLVLFLPEKSLLWRLVVVLDSIFSMLLTSSLSAALAVAVVGKKGNHYAGWLPICAQVEKFCDQITAALVASFVALILHTALLLYSIHNVLDPLVLAQKS